MRISDWSSDVCSPDLLSAANGAQAPVLVHRDFHSPNLMVCDSPAYGSNPGILDFQDALAGPITYDLASLVTDARTTWEEPQQLDLAVRYLDMAPAAGLPVERDFAEIGRAPVRTPVTNAHLVCRFPLETKTYT